MYCFDIAVIGAGRSGMTAALGAHRATGGSAHAPTVAIFDPAPPGGTASFTPPDSPKAREAANTIAALTECGIPVFPRLVEHARQVCGRWRLSSGDTELCEARAVVVACGLRPLANEAAYLDKGIHFVEDPSACDFAALFAPPQVRRVLVVGNIHTERLLPLLGAAVRDDQSVYFAIDEAAGTPLPDVYYRLKRYDGRVISYEGTRHIEAVNIEVRNTAMRLPCDTVIVDNAAFAARPSAALQIDPIERTGTGRIVADSDGQTGIPGLYAAGAIIRSEAPGAAGEAAGRAAVEFIESNL